MSAKYNLLRSVMPIGLLFVFSVLSIGNAQQPTESRLLIGTGFIISTDGAIISTAHVVNGCGAVDVLQNGTSPVRAAEVKIDRQADLALLRAKLPNPARPLAIRSDTTPQLGERVYFLGFPLQRPLMPGHPSFFESVVSGMGGIRGEVAVFRIQAVALPGTSGAPVLDLHGRVIGVVKTHIVETTANGGPTLGGESFVIPGDSIVRFAGGEIQKEQSQSGAPLSAVEVATRALSGTVMITCQKDAER